MQGNSVTSRGGHTQGCLYTHSPYALCTVQDDATGNDCSSQDASTHARALGDSALHNIAPQSSSLCVPCAETSISHTHPTPTTPRFKPSSVPRVQVRQRRNEHSVRSQRPSSLNSATLLSSPLIDASITTDFAPQLSKGGCATPAPMQSSGGTCVTPTRFSGPYCGNSKNNEQKNFSFSGNYANTTSAHRTDNTWHANTFSSNPQVQNGSALEGSLPDMQQGYNPRVFPERQRSQSISSSTEPVAEDSKTVEQSVRRMNSNSYGRYTPSHRISRNMCRPVGSVSSSVVGGAHVSTPVSANGHGVGGSNGHYPLNSSVGFCDKESPLSSQAQSHKVPYHSSSNGNYRQLPSYVASQTLLGSNSTANNVSGNTNNASMAFSSQNSAPACGANPPANSSNSMPSSEPAHFLSEMHIGDVVYGSKRKTNYSLNHSNGNKHNDISSSDLYDQHHEGYARYSQIQTDDSGSVSSQTCSSMSSIRDNLPLCPKDHECTLVNNHKHQRQFVHTCRLFPCYHGHVKRHAKIFRHVEGQLAQQEGVHSNRITSQALTSVNFSSISPEAPNAYRIYVSHGSKMYEIFGDWNSVKVHTFKRYLHQVYHIAPHAQILVLMKTKKIMDDDISSVKSYGVEVDSVVQLQLDTEPDTFANLLDEL